MSTTTATEIPEQALQSATTKPTMTTSSPSSKSGAPFDLETTLTYDSIEYWAKKDPKRTALVITDKQWQVDKEAKLKGKHTVGNPKEWTVVTYEDFYALVNRFRVALHQAGIPLPKPGQRPYKILLLFAPSNRAQVLALLIAMQATGSIFLFGGRPEDFGGLKGFLATMLRLEPDIVIANRVVHTIFRTLCMTLKYKKKVKWIKGTVLTKKAPKLTPATLQEYEQHKADRTKAISLDTVATIMFSSGTTGPPSPIEITHRMLCFQAAGYAEMLQNHLDRDLYQENTTTTTSGARRDGPWISTHIFVNFVMLDVVCGGTAVMQPMGIAAPDKTVDADMLLTVWDHFNTQICSAPPALWTRLIKLKRQREQQPGSKPLVQDLKLAFVGGAETSASFARDMAKEFIRPSQDGSKSGVYRVYGTTQVLPIAMASDTEISQAEDAHRYCEKGYGVLLGSVVDGLDVTIDKEKFESKGGKSKLTMASLPDVEIGELCVLGEAVSPSMEIASQPSGKVPTYIFRSGDICYLEPTTQNIYFMGRMAQAVDCGSEMGKVPPVGVEMVALETKTVHRCAFVGVPRKDGTVSPTLVVQFEDPKHGDVEAARKAIRTALEGSVWAPILKHCSNLSVVVYPKVWPVDHRHSSKTNRFMLRDWAAKTDSKKFHSV